MRKKDIVHNQYAIPRQSSTVENESPKDGPFVLLKGVLNNTLQKFRLVSSLEFVFALLKIGWF